MSPTVLDDSLTFRMPDSSGILTFSFPLSTAASNLTKGNESAINSSLTVGTVYCSSETVSGSNPAIKAEVSRIMTLVFFGSVNSYPPR